AAIERPIPLASRRPSFPRPSRHLRLPPPRAASLTTHTSMGGSARPPKPLVCCARSFDRGDRSREPHVQIGGTADVLHGQNGGLAPAIRAGELMHFTQQPQRSVSYLGPQEPGDIQIQAIGLLTRRTW